MKVFLALWDELSDIIYVLTADFYDSSIRDAMIFFLIISPIIQSLAWSYILTKLQIKDVDIDNQEAVKDARSIADYLISYVKESIKHYSDIGKMMIMKMPIAIAITISQQMNIFPFAFFSIIYMKYSTIITQGLMNRL